MMVVCRGGGCVRVVMRRGGGCVRVVVRCRYGNCV